MHKPRTLTLFFSRDVSLANWQAMGILDRECQLYRKLCEQGWRVNFVTYGGQEDRALASALTPIKVLCNQWGLSNKHYRENIPYLFGRELSESDLIKIHQIDGGEVALECAKQWAKPLYVRCGYLSSYTGKERVAVGRISEEELADIVALERELFGAADEITLTTEEMAEYVRESYPMTADSIHVIPNYVNTELFSPKKVERFEPGVVYVGRVSKEKNIESLSKACGQLGLPLHLVGSTWEEVRSNGITLDHNCQVKLWGRLNSEQIRDFICNYRIFALVSLYEGNPKALLEAMSCEMAVLGSDVKGIRAIIKDGVNGVLCGTDAESIRKGLERILADKDFAEGIGRNARLNVLETNSFEIVYEKELAVLNAMLGKKREPKTGLRQLFKAKTRGGIVKSLYVPLLKVKRKVLRNRS